LDEAGVKVIDENFSYINEESSFSIANRKALSHNMPYNHFHSTYELYYLVSGERCFFIKDRTLIIKEGDLVLIPPNILHRTTNASMSKHEKVIINFQKDLLLEQNLAFFQVLHSLFEREYVIISMSVSNRNYVENIFRNILIEVQNKNTAYEMWSQTLLIQLLIYICRFVEQNTIEALAFTSSIHERMSQIVRFINEHYTQALDLHYLSERFFISPFHLCREFKEATGFTFIEYLNSVRIKEAKKLLEQSSLKVNKIAERVGFGSITHFGRVFRQITGHAPLYYRKAANSKG
jgi:YesN/AraC family two-component response regulator